MVGSYFRHGPTEVFGLVCSASSISVYDGKLAYVPALEDVLVWDVKRGEMLAMWHETGHRAEVTCIVQSPTKDVFAVGYADGSVRLWSASTESVITTFNGHRKAVSALSFDNSGTRLASGSQDNDIILWDVTAEAGLYRLRGHRDQVTALKFLSVPESPSTSSNSETVLLSSSKDTFLKLWDLSTQHCFQTIVAHHAEVWSMDINSAHTMLLTGGGNGELKAWQIDQSILSHGLKQDRDDEVGKVIKPLSHIPISSVHRVSQIIFCSEPALLAVQCQDRSVEIFRIRSEEEIRKKQLRRQKRSKEKEGKNSLTHPNSSASTHTIAGDEGKSNDVNLVDVFSPYVIIRASGKIRSFCFDTENNDKPDGPQILLALASNALEVYRIPKPVKSQDQSPEATRIFTVDLPGHRTDVRSLSVSSDDGLIASASNGSLKIWNINTNACIRTMDCGYAICSSFLRADRYVVVGTKAGELVLYDIASSSVVEHVEAHSGTIWSLHIQPNGQGLVTGGADKDVKFWNFEYSDTGRDNEKKMSLVPTKTLKMSDDVLSVRYSPNGKLLAVALLDSTVKIFYQDTLKFFLSLYGHKLPVLSMDISHDSKLIVTCSADKNVKIWGLEFGDCHKSIFAHDESVMQVAFEHESHFFWTVGKDKCLKYWDGDKFENIQKLEGHHSEIWALALSHQGKFVVTGSHDKSIRIWEKLDEELFIEEERERELESLYDNGVADNFNRVRETSERGLDLRTADRQIEAEVTAVSKQTTETLMAGERIIEALDLADAERLAMRDYELQKQKGLGIDLQPPARNPILVALNLEPEAYVLRVVERIRSTALQDALLVLPFGKVISFMNYLNTWVSNGWNLSLISYITFFLIKTHHHQIVANRVLRTAMIPLRESLRNALRKQKHAIGYNLAALQFIRRKDEADRLITFYEQNLDEHQIPEHINEGKKRKRISLKA